MKRKITFLAVAFLFFLAKSGVAQNEGIQRGDKELTFNGYIFSMTGGGNKNVSGNFFFNYGEYMSKSVLFGFGPGLNISYNDIDEKVQTDLSASLYFKFNFSNVKKSIPYSTIQYYQYSFKAPEGGSLLDNGYAQAGLGLKNFINEFLSVDIQLNYGVAVKETSMGLLQLSIGLSYIF